MIKLCAAVALACTIAGGSAAAEAATGPVAHSAYASSPEARARAAVAPLVVERALCVRQSRRRTLCLLAHPAAAGRSCRSAVVVRPRRVHVIQTAICFEFSEVNP